VEGKRIRALVVGANGEMGRACVRYMTERGVDLVAAVGRRTNLGEDIGALAGIGENGILLEGSADLAAIVERSKPDAAIFCTAPLSVIAPDIKTCVERGVNVITIAEEAYYPAVFEPKLQAQLDALAKESGASIVGLGMQDVNWSNECVVMSANCITLNSIYGENWCILDHVGPMEIEGIGIGLTEVEFHDLHKDDPTPRSHFTPTLYQIADELGLTVTEEVNAKCAPLLATNDYESWTGVIPKGRVIGSTLSTELKTEEGISLVGRFCYSFAQDGAAGVNIWRFDGEPSFEIVTDDPRPDMTTTIDAVTRIPDVINARPGFLTVKDLPKPFYRSKPLPEYLHD